MINVRVKTKGMQEFATGKATARGIAIAPKLNCKTKYRYAVLVMKLTAILLLVGCLQLSARGISQTITLSVKDADLQTVFTAIEKQTDYVFFVKKQLLQNAKRVTIKVSGASLQQVLDLCFKDQPFTYLIAGKMITISKRTEKASVETTIQTTNQAGQLVDVKGRVVDENGYPAQGVNIVVKGTNKGTTTNLGGDFTLKDVDENSILVVTSVGYDRQEILVKNKTFVSLQLRVAVGNLDELQVIAYGTTSKRFNTGNVSTVKATDIEKQPVNNPLLSLQGRVPGLVITQGNGLAGGAIRIRIQGQNSLLSGNDPLIIIDGVPYPTELPSAVITPLRGSGELQGNSENALSYINPNDIESISVLKDADATAIYGSRAANGAIIITTKKGTAGKSKLDINLQQGWGHITRKADMMNRRQYLDIRNEAFKNDGIIPTTLNAPDLLIWDTTRETDWQQTLIGGTAEFNNINVGISGGSQAVQYKVAGTWRRETTVFPNDFSDQKSSTNLNLNNSQVSQRFHFQVSANYSVDKNRLPANDFSTYAILLPPIAPPLYNADGTLNWAPNTAGSSTWTNPLGNTIYQTYQVNTNTLVANTILGYRILSNLEFKSNFGYNYIESNDFTLRSLFALSPEQRTSSTRQAYYGERNVKTWIIEPQIIYKRNIGKGKFDALIGTTFQKTDGLVKYLSGSGYLNDLVLSDIRSAASIVAVTSTNNTYKYNAGFSRLNFNWEDKYIINFSARRDGSSRFGDKNKFHNFGSIGMAWIFNQSSFIQKSLPFMSFGKLRASYGSTGNDQIGDYSFLDLYSTVNPGIPYQGTVGLNAGGFFNPYLQWEETRKLSAGIDVGFISDKILLSVTYANNRSSNLLVNYLLPAMTGNQNIRRNFQAIVENSSWELSASTVNVKNKNFTWSSNINLTVPRNKLVEFPGLASSPYATTLVVGQPINVQKMFHFLGVDQATGLYVVANSHGDPTAMPDYSTDRTVLINTYSKFFGGMQNSFRYKGFQLEFLFQFVKQKGASNVFRIGTATPGALSFNGWGNQPVNVIQRWKKPGDIASIQKYSTNNTLVTTSLLNALNSDAAVSDDASFARLKNMAISWELPISWKAKVHVQNCRLYAQGQNLLTFTSYIGTDPENQSFTSLPPLRILTIGLQVGL